MHSLTKMTVGMIAAAGIAAATIAPATAADNGTGWAAVKYNPAERWCEIEVAGGSRAEAQIYELKRIYQAHFTAANTDMRRKVAEDLGLTPSQISNRQYGEADARKIGMTKAQLQALHDRLNRKDAVEFIISTGASYYGVHDSQRTTNEQVKYLKYDREHGLGRGVYWVTNDAGRVDYVPPQPVKDYFQKRLLGSYKQVLIDKQRGAELSNYATQMCYKSRHNGNKPMGVPIGLLDEIHKYNPSWKNWPTLQMKAAAKKKQQQQQGHSGTQQRPSAPTPSANNNPALNKRDNTVRTPVDRSKIIAAKQRHSTSANGYKMIPMSLNGSDYVGDPNATIAPDGRVIYASEPAGDDGHGNSGSSGLFGSS